MCRYLGLPVTLSISFAYYQWSWPTKIYKALHGYQVARGFGLPTCVIMSPENQFQEIDVEEAQSTSGSYQNDADVGQGNSTSPQPVQGATGGSLVSTLSSWFTLDAIESAGNLCSSSLNPMTWCFKSLNL
ncbi:hypothetical protein L218DRAFT_406732 [Marasmius fiardii PR-910]|nr:hypothetical protein L218DRAFT_406732 [Marasmius fiardii PR-910]